MSNPGDSDATAITSIRQLADSIAEGCKPRDRFTIGTEHEKFGFARDGHASPPYAPEGIRAILEAMAADGWEQILDRGTAAERAAFLQRPARGGAALELAAD